MERANGGLDLGGAPRVVGIISARASLERSAAELTPLCDLVELRLDLLGADAPGWLDAARRWEAAGLPVLLTLRLQSEGGAWRRPDAARETLLRAAVENLAAVDVELDSVLCAAICAYAAARGKTAVVSYHNFQATPPLTELRQIVARIRRQTAAVPKVAVMIQSEQDAAALEALVRDERRRLICGIGMGPLGVATRLALPALGSCLA
jgi:3-dehydroquinate dehydratase type I